MAIQGKDLISIAKTGSGKTCGFLLPLFHLYKQNKALAPGKGPMMLVLAPTRELACQILEETQKFGRPIGIRSVCCYGGSPKYPQIAALQRGVECVIATPGRINDLIEMRKADLSGVRFVVLDEADRMLGMFTGEACPQFASRVWKKQTLACVPSPLISIAPHTLQTWVSNRKSGKSWTMSQTPRSGKPFFFLPLGPKRFKGSRLISWPILSRSMSVKLTCW